MEDVSRLNTLAGSFLISECQSTLNLIALQQMFRLCLNVGPSVILSFSPKQTLEKSRKVRALMPSPLSLTHTDFAAKQSFSLKHVLARSQMGSTCVDANADLL